MSIASLQRRADLIGPDADTFNPERWDGWKPATWSFLPFNHGPRICLGKNFAVMQMEYVLCRLFQEFTRVELVGDYGQREIKTRLALNTKPAQAIMLRFVR
jgi:cytochrome P450